MEFRRELSKQPKLSVQEKIDQMRDEIKDNWQKVRDERELRIKTIEL